MNIQHVINTLKFNGDRHPDTKRLGLIDLYRQPAAFQNQATGVPNSAAVGTRFKVLA